MHATDSPFGVRLSDQEYEQRMIAIHDGVPPLPSERQQAVLRRQELDLTIDHKLGVDFPVKRRAALWQAQRRIGRRQVPTVLLAFARKALGSRQPLDEPLLQLLVREYSKVLTRPELSAMLDLSSKNDLPDAPGW